MKIVNRNHHEIVFIKESAEDIYNIITAAQEDGWKLDICALSQGIGFDEEAGGIKVHFCKMSESEEKFDLEKYRFDNILNTVL